MLRCPDRLPCDAGRRAPTNPRGFRPPEAIRAPASNRPWRPTIVLRGRVRLPEPVSTSCHLHEKLRISAGISDSVFRQESPGPINAQSGVNVVGCERLADTSSPNQIANSSDRFAFSGHGCSLGTQDYSTQQIDHFGWSPSVFDPRHNPSGERNGIRNGGFRCWRRSPVPVGETPGCKNTRHDCQTYSLRL
jgi:hypothetical protein